VPPPPLRYRLIYGILCPVMKLVGLSCRQFAELAAHRFDRPLTKFENLRFRFHRMMCGLCRPLLAQLDALRKLTRCACRENQCAPPAVELPAATKQRIRETLEQEP